MKFGSYVKIDTDLTSVQRLVPSSKAERFEGIAFSSSGIMAVATSQSNSILLFDQFRAFVNAESSKYARIIKETGVTAN